MTQRDHRRREDDKMILVIHFYFLRRFDLYRAIFRDKYSKLKRILLVRVHLCIC